MAMIPSMMPQYLLNPFYLVKVLFESLSTTAKIIRTKAKKVGL